MTFEGKEKLRKDSLEECRRVLNDLVSSPLSNKCCLPALSCNKGEA